VIERAEACQAEHAEMSAKVSDVEARVVLAKLVEIQARELITVNNEMLGREITMGGARRQAREFRAARLEASQEITQEGFAFRMNAGEKLLPTCEGLKVASKGIATTRTGAAIVEAEQPLRSSSDFL